MVEDGGYTWLRWIPLLPLFAAAVHGVTLGVMRRPLPRTAAIALSCSAPAISFIVCFVALIELTGLPEGSRILVDDLFTWIAAGDFGAEFALVFDPVSSVLALVATGVGTLVHVAAVGFLREDARDDRGFNRFLAYLNLATFSMLSLVLAENLLVMFLGWQGVGLCTFLLLGFWYEGEAQDGAPTQSFILGRIGDAGFLAGTFLLTRGLAQAGVSGTSFSELASGFDQLLGVTLSFPAVLGGEWALSAVIAWCFAVAAVGRGAQWPLHVWTHGLHAAPAPVAAMMLPVTGATAGVFLLCRLSFVFQENPGVSALIAWIGALTAILAVLTAFLQTDLRKVLVALMGVQLGFMFVAAGCGAYSAALFHAVTSALFMPLLFLAAGSILRAARGEADIHQLGGLWDYLHRTKWIFAVGALAMAGAPLSSGFYSREGVLLAANLAESVPRNGALYLALLATVGALAFVAARLQLRIFHGRCRLSADLRSQIAEPDGIVLAPLYGLAVLASLGGFLGPPAALNPFPVEDAVSNSFANFLEPLLGLGVAAGAEAGEVGLAVLSTLAGGAGAALAWYGIHQRPELGARVRKAIPLGDGARLSGLAPVYERAVVRPVLWLADRVLDRGLESRLLDGLVVRGSVRSVNALATGVLRRAHSGLVRSSLLWVVLGSLAIASYLVV